SIPEGGLTSVTLAIGTAGNPSDSSNCGGINFDQSQTITAQNPSAVFIFGTDKFTVTPSGGTPINPGDTLTFRPVPLPQPLFNLNPLGLTLTSSPIGNGQACIAYADFGAKGGGNSVCPEFQTN